MAVRQMYTLFDVKSEAFLPPWSTPTLGLAYRMLADMVNGAPRAEDPVTTHPEDFELYQVGHFDDESGSIAGGDPKLICKLSDLKVDRSE